MARTHQNEEAHRRFAAAHGCSMRTAQRHSARGSPEWVAFVASDHRAILKGDAPAGAAGAEDTALVLPPAPMLTNKAPEEMTPEEYAEYEAFEALRRAVHTSRTSKFPPEQSAALRHVAEILPRFFQARKERQRAEERERKVVPVEEFYTFRALVERVAQLIKSLPELAPRLNPSAPSVARESLLAWQQQAFNPAVEAVYADAAAKAACA